MTWFLLASVFAWAIGSLVILAVVVGRRAWRRRRRRLAYPVDEVHRSHLRSIAAEDYAKYTGRRRPHRGP